MDILTEILGSIPQDSTFGQAVTGGFNTLFAGPSMCESYEWGRLYGVPRDYDGPLPDTLSTEDDPIEPKEVKVERVDEDSVKVGDQIWMTSNLQMPGEYPEQGIYKANGETFFTWKAAMLAAKSYGDGWRLPSDADWDKFANFCGGYEVAGHTFKNFTTNVKALRVTTEFDSRLPGGYHTKEHHGVHEGMYCDMWTSFYNGREGWAHAMQVSAQDNAIIKSSPRMTEALSVRLVKDA